MVYTPAVTFGPRAELTRLHLPNDPQAAFHGALGVVWLLGLWAAAPVIGTPRSAAQRIALTLALGCLIPFTLGLVNVLYWWSLWTVLAALLAIRIVRFRSRAVADFSHGKRQWDVVIAVFVLVALAWPVAVRPTMDGDTLIYHLPNAAGWVAQHGIWTTGTRYWWYPPASELFAGGLLAIGGIGVAGWAGLLPAVLLVLTLRGVAERSGAPIAGTLAACALLATPMATVQIISLQNDVWLTALFLFALVEYLPQNFATLAITKPYGSLFALVGASTLWPDRRKLITAVVLAVAAPAIWLVHDLVLIPHAIVPIWTTKIANPLQTTIAGQAPASLLVLLGASLRAGIVWSALLLAGVASIGFSRERRFVWPALFALLLFFFIPTAYAGGPIEQLATGASLRFALPLAGLGALWLASLPWRAGKFVAIGTAAGTVGGIAAQWRLFGNDATTHDGPMIAIVASIIAVVALLTSNVRARTAIAVATLVCAGAIAGGLARSHPIGYIVDAYGGAFGYPGVVRAARVVTFGVPAGAAITVDAGVRAFDGLDNGICAEARTLRAVVVTTTTKLPAIRCGRVVYQDARTAVLDVMQPTPDSTR